MYYLVAVVEWKGETYELRLKNASDFAGLVFRTNREMPGSVAHLETRNDNGDKKKEV